MITRKHAWAMWFIASIFYAYQYILRVMPNIMIDEIIAKYQIDVTTFGQLSGIYYIGYALVHLPLGILFDKYGPKNILPIFIMLTVIGTIPFAYGNIWIYPMLGRLLIGIGSSAAILGAFKVIALSFKKENFSKMLSICVTIGLVGAIYGGGPLNYIKTQLGTAFIIHMLMIIGIILAATAYMTIPDQESIKQESILNEINQVLKNYKIWAVCIFSGLMVGPLEGFADVWGTKFLKLAYNFDDEKAAYLPSLIFIGMCFGAPLLSSIAEKTKSYLETIIVCAVLMCAGFVIIMMGNISLINLSVVFIVIGFLSSYQIIAIFKASTYVDEKAAGLATALTNMVIMIFGYVFHSSISKIIDVKTLEFGIGIKTYNYGIAVIPIGLAIAALGFTMLLIMDRKNNSNKV
ncbi:MAG: MFS transporter [Alphaproteobacteria bacterium]